MPEADQQYKGTDRQAYLDYTERDISPAADLALVRRCNRRIQRASRLLSIERRKADAAEIEQYLAPRIEYRHRDKRGKIEFRYMPYLLPIMEDAIGRALPGLPAPSIEDRNEQVMGFADTVRALVSYTFSAPRCQVLSAAQDAMWDDARWGMAVLKTTWRTTLEPREPSRVTDDDQIAQEAAKAQTENDSIAGARIADSDNHEVHLPIHANYMESLPPDHPDWQYLDLHMRAHAAERVAVTHEWPVVETISPDRFVYDPDVPWDRRTWEAELRSVKLKTLFDLKYRNLNTANLPIEIKPEEKHPSWEDMTVQVWEFHEIDTGQLYVIPVNGREDGLPLYKGPWEWGEVDIYIPVVTRPYKSGRSHMHGAATAALCVPILERLADIDYAIDRHVFEHSNYKQVAPKGTADSLKAGLNDPNQRFVEASPEAALGMKEYKPPPLPTPVLEQHEREMNKLRKITGGDPQDTGEDHTHAITASESLRRAAQSDRRTKRNQEIMGKALAHIARNFIRLYKMFATQNIALRVVTEVGPEYLALDPSDIPEDIDMYVDLRGESDEARAIEYQIVREAFEFATKMAYPLDVIEAVEYAMRRGGVRRPERFRMPETPTPVVEGEQGSMPQTIPISAYQGGAQTPVQAGAIS